MHKESNMHKGIFAQRVKHAKKDAFAQEQNKKTLYKNKKKIQTKVKVRGNSDIKIKNTNKN